MKRRMMDIPNNDIDASFEIDGDAGNNSWVMIEQQAFSVHEMRLALATVHEYIKDNTVNFCAVNIESRIPVAIDIFIYSRSSTIYVSMGYPKFAEQSETFEIVELPLSEFLSIVQFVSDFLS